MSGNRDAEKKLREQVAAQEEEQLSKGPSLPLNGLRTSAVAFENQAKEELRLIRTSAELKQKKGEEVIRTITQNLEVLIPLRAEAMQELERVVVEYDGAHTLVFSPAARDLAARLFDEVSTTRTALTDALTDGSETAQAVRDRCGVGESLRRDQVLPVRDLAVRQIAALSDPLFQDYLEGRGIVTDAYVLPLKHGLAPLEAELRRAPPPKSKRLREGRDRAHVRVEVLSNRIIGQVLAARGVAARDALKDLLPSPPTRSAKKAEEKKDEKKEDKKDEKKVDAKDEKKDEKKELPPAEQKAEAKSETSAESKPEAKTEPPPETKAEASAG